MSKNRFFQFNYVPYPLWRRKLPALVGAVLQPLFRRWLPSEADFNPPATADAMADYMARWGLAGGSDQVKLTETVAVERVKLSEPLPLTHSPNSERGNQTNTFHAPKQSLFEQAASKDLSSAIPIEPYTGKVRLPAQWEAMDGVILTWPVFYPPMWEQHAQMAEAITPAANLTILVPTPMWAQAVRVFLAERGKTQLERVRFLQLPTDDVWVRDYGPIVGLGADGGQVCVKAIFDPLPSYPQEQDNAMATRWAAYEEIPVTHLDLHIEGGNLWSDGAGTIILSEQVFYSNPGLTHDDLLKKLHAVFDFQKLIITPRLNREETGHVDLVMKLADANTVLVSAPDVLYNGGQLRKAAELMRRETNAAGEAYRVFELPVPPLYLNWLVYPIWRTYTNALTVNGRVLVPVFGVETDEQALAVYREAMPNHEIIPIQCAVSVNGGGAVHCLTKEVPKARR